MERTFAFRPPQPRSRRRNLFVSISAVMVVILGSVLVFYVDDAGQRWFALALVLNMLFVLLSNTTEAFYAGAFGGRFVEGARKLRAVAYIVAWPVAINSWAALGYYLVSMSDGSFTGSSGALAGGAAGIVFSSACLLYDLRRGWARVGERVRPERR